MPDHDSPSLVYVVGRVHQGVKLRKALAPWGLSLPELTTLSVLRTRPGLSNAQLSRRALITPQSMNEVIAELERRGLVLRTVDPSHGRILRAHLTPDGEQLVAEVDPVVEGLQSEMLADVPAEQHDVVVAGLVSAMRHLRER